MVKNTIIFIAVAAIAVSLGLRGAQADGPLTAPDKGITIEGKKPVTFQHSVHLEAGVSCGECHHDSKHQPLRSEAIGMLTSPESLQCV